MLLSIINLVSIPSILGAHPILHLFISSSRLIVPELPPQHFVHANCRCSLPKCTHNPISLSLTLIMKFRTYGSLQIKKKTSSVFHSFRLDRQWWYGPIESLHLCKRIAHNEYVACDKHIREDGMYTSVTGTLKIFQVLCW